MRRIPPLNRANTQDFSTNGPLGARYARLGSLRGLLVWGVQVSLVAGVACVPPSDAKRNLRVDEMDPNGPTPPAAGPDAGVDRPPSPGADAGTPTGPTYWTDIEPLIRRDCVACHQDPRQFGAPMSLATYEDFMVGAYSDAATPVHEMVAYRIDRSNGLAPMPPRQTLTDEEIALIAEWSAIGAPEGKRPGTEPTEPAPDAGTNPNPTPDAGTGNPGEEPYIYIDAVAPQAAIRAGTEDLYGCFRTVIDTQVPLHAVEITPLLDNLETVHHILLFRDGGNNYPAQKVGFLCSADTVLQGDWELLHGWAPGGEPMIFPPEAGVRLEDGDHIVVQIHYNNYGTTDAIDSSGMTFKATASLRQYDAAVLGVGTQSFSLPPGQTSVERSGTCDIQNQMKVFGYSPHMHLLGKAARMERIRGGQTELLADVPNFLFEQQITYDADWDMMPGDQLRATCVWDTTPRTQDTRFGEGTEDEMCYMFIGHYPPFGAYSCGD